jgi:hypothetical protein
MWALQVKLLQGLGANSNKDHIPSLHTGLPKSKNIHSHKLTLAQSNTCSGDWGSGTSNTRLDMAPGMARVKAVFLQAYFLIYACITPVLGFFPILVYIESTSGFPEQPCHFGGLSACRITEVDALLFSMYRTAQYREIGHRERAKHLRVEGKESSII